MAHIQIKAGPGIPGSGSVVVDGVDISNHILAEGFTVNCPQTPDGIWSVTMTVMAESLDVDLPDAEVDAEYLTPPRRLCDKEATA